MSYISLADVDSVGRGRGMVVGDSLAEEGHARWGLSVQQEEGLPIQTHNSSKYAFFSGS